MEDYLNDVDASSEQIVDAQPEAPETSEVTEEVESVVETAKPQQSAEENARFAAARRQAENELRAEREQKELLLNALGQYGYTGSAQEIFDNLTARTQGISPEEAREQREAAAAENAKQNQLQMENETLKNRLFDFVGKEELTKLKSSFPEDAKIQSLKSVGELGMDFLKLATAMDGDSILAYEAFRAKTARETKPVPKDIGAVNSSSSKEKDFYTSSEVDKLTSKDFDNPKIMERVRQSMLKWK